jgi:hypothetical protein
MSLHIPAPASRICAAQRKRSPQPHTHVRRTQLHRGRAARRRRRGPAPSSGDRDRREQRPADVLRDGRIVVVGAALETSQAHRFLRSAVESAACGWKGSLDRQSWSRLAVLTAGGKQGPSGRCYAVVSGGRRGLPGALERAVDGAAGDVEELGELGACVLAGRVHGEVGLLPRRELGLLATQPALGLGDLLPSRVRARVRPASNSATMASTLNSSRPTGSVGSCSEPPRFSLTWRRGEVVDDVARVRQRAREPVELGDDERVAGAAGRERFAQSGAVPVGPS